MGPLNELTKMSIPFDWCPSFEVNFERINIKLTNSASFVFPYPNQRCILLMYASKHSWSGVLTQERTTGIKWETITAHPITCISAMFISSQKNWTTLVLL